MARALGLSRMNGSSRQRNRRQTCKRLPHEIKFVQQTQQRETIRATNKSRCSSIRCGLNFLCTILLKRPDVPKVAQDDELRTQLQQFIQASQMSIPQAARELGVDRVSLWRFLTTGKARKDRRQVYHASLARLRLEKTETKIPVSVSLPERVTTPLPVHARELRHIRRVCDSLLRMLDAYEGALLKQGGETSPMSRMR